MIGKTDPRYDEAVALVRKHKRGSITLIQRHMQIGYNRAHALIDAMVGTVLTDMPPVGKVIPAPVTAARAEFAEMERHGNADDIQEARVHLAVVEHAHGVRVDAPTDKWGKDGLCKGCGYEYQCRKNSRCERSFEPLPTDGVRVDAPSPCEW